MDKFIWLIPLLPLAGFIINGLGRNTLSKGLIGFIGSLMVLISFGISVGLFFQIKSSGTPINVQLFDWFGAGSFKIQFAFLIDQLSSIMLLIITGVGFLIHLYSTGYMKDDAGFGKFFAYLNLFIFFMLLLVMGSKLPGDVYRLGRCRIMLILVDRVLVHQPKLCRRCKKGFHHEPYW